MYLLVTVIERDISVEAFLNKDDAYCAMKNAFVTSTYDANEKIEDSEAQLTDTTAWITDGNNHDNYDWKILELPTDIL